MQENNLLSKKSPLHKTGYGKGENEVLYGLLL